MQKFHTEQRGFSTIIAILMTAFLTILSASILNLFIVENGMNHFLGDGISAYMSAEWVLEYSLLKSANHREGFTDSISSGDKESLILNTRDTVLGKKITIESSLEASDSSYTGSVIAGGFEIIPLFYDRGQVIQNSAKNPNKDTSNVTKTTAFIVTQDNDLGWNIIGNDADGRTYGISGTGSLMNSFGNTPSANTKEGFKKEMNNTQDMMTAGMQDINTFLATYDNNYLILSNIWGGPVTYRIVAPGSDKFSLPVRRVRASSMVGKSKQNIDFSENRSRLFDMLKYSVFNK